MSRDFLYKDYEKDIDDILRSASRGCSNGAA